MVTTIAVGVIVMIAVPVAFQAQRVAGQDALESLRAEVTEAGLHQSELRAAVAEAEAPAQILDAAENLGMVQPAAVVAVPAPAPAESADRR